MVKRPVILIASIALNLVLAGVWFTTRRPAPLTPQAENTPPPYAARRPTATEKIPTAPTLLPSAILITQFKWNLIESDDYYQYVANLRTVECPEWLIQDILVADIQSHYREKLTGFSASAEAVQPWHGHDRQQIRRRERMTQLHAMSQQKKRLLKELLGIDWTDNNHWLDSYDEESVWFGFMGHKKSNGLMAVFENTQEAAAEIRQLANGILIDEDHARLNQLQESLVSQLRLILTPTEFEELELRAQWEEKINHGDLHFEGMSLSGVELRALARASLILGRTLADAVTGGDRDVPEAEEEARETQFIAELRKVVGPARLAEYERAQDHQFREAFEFTSEQHLPVSAATRISSAINNATEQAEQIKSDESLTRGQQAEALATLKASTTKALANVLGPKLDDYLSSKNGLLDSILELGEIEPQTAAGPGVIP